MSDMSEAFSRKRTPALCWAATRTEVQPEDAAGVNTVGVAPMSPSPMSLTRPSGDQLPSTDVAGGGWWVVGGGWWVEARDGGKLFSGTRERGTQGAEGAEGAEGKVEQGVLEQ